MPSSVLTGIAELAAACILALLLRRFVGFFTYVKGSSMLDTLKSGEILLATRYGLFGTVRRFDVVICRYPDRKGYFVKRVIGLPGERISMAEDCVFIDGEELAESFPRRSCLRALPETTIPVGFYFLMGDNRAVSRDSRRVGAIREKELLARARVVVWPLRSRRRIR